MRKKNCVKTITHTSVNMLILLLLVVYMLTGCVWIKNTRHLGIVEYLSQPEEKIAPMMKDQGAAVQAILDLHQQDGGSTYSLRWGNLANTALYVVSLYPDRALILPGKAIGSKILTQFMQENQDLLSDPRCVLGTWFNDDGNTYLDVSAVFSDQDTAIQLAKEYNQIAIWDLKESQEITTGGTGAPPENLLPAEERLPRLPIQ